MCVRTVSRGTVSPSPERFAFEQLGLELVAITHDVENENARRSIERYVERFGGRRDGRLRNRTPYRGEVADVHRYTIGREQYREAAGRK